MRTAIALLTRKYFLDMQMYSREREQKCVCLHLHWQREPETCLAGYLVAQAKKTHLSNSEQHMALFRIHVITLCRLGVCCRVYLCTHIYAAPFLPKFNTQNTEVQCVVYCFILVFCASETTISTLSEVQSWWLGWSCWSLKVWNPPRLSSVNTDLPPSHSCVWSTNFLRLSFEV